jgi:hypothetical protein
MRLRTALVAAALLGVPATASAQEVVPLTGTGENMQPIARMKLPGANEIAVAGDWAFLASTAVEENCGCLYIVNIKDPAHPYLQGVWDAAKTDLKSQSYGDVDISPDGNLAVLTNTRGSGPTWDVLIDTTDKAHPKLLSHVDDDGTMQYVHTSTLDNHLLYMNPQVAPFYPQPGDAAVTVVDITDPAHPKIVGKVTVPGADAGFAHDTYIDHRPDRRNLMYAASVDRSDVIDVTDPLKPNWLQSTTGDYTVSHEVMPNFDRTMLLVTDEGLAGGGIDTGAHVCGNPGAGPARVDSGSLHFYAAAPDGTFANGGAVELGTFNPGISAGAARCIAHIIWPAPDQNRLTQAYYDAGVFVIDFDDPANVQVLGSFKSDGATYWSNKPHNGYLYASNRNGTLDILRYTGEGGTKWPATAGPAEIQLSQRQGVPYVPIAGSTPPPAPPPAPAATFGRFKFTIKVRRVPGRRGRKARLTLSFTQGGKRVARARVRRRAGRRARVRVSGVAATGAYRWALKAGRHRVARGRVKVRAVAGLESSARFVARAR